MLEQQIAQTGERLAGQLRDHLISVLYYPHPFGEGGFVAVFEDGRGGFVDLVARAFSCVPPGTHLTCVRRSELRELSLPIHSWLDATNRHIPLPFWLRHSGVVLYGADVRDEIPLPPDPVALLDVHIEVTLHYMRNHIILGKCVRGDYEGLIRRLDSQMRRLMATALLARGEWDVSSDAAPGRFFRAGADAELLRLWDEFAALSRPAQAAAHTAVTRETAFEAVWLFENWVSRLRYTHCPQPETITAEP